MVKIRRAKGKADVSSDPSVITDRTVILNVGTDSISSFLFKRFFAGKYIKKITVKGARKSGSSTGRIYLFGKRTSYGSTESYFDQYVYSTTGEDYSWSFSSTGCLVSSTENLPLLSMQYLDVQAIIVEYY